VVVTYILPALQPTVTTASAGTRCGARCASGWCTMPPGRPFRCGNP